MRRAAIDDLIFRLASLDASRGANVVSLQVEFDRQVGAKTFAQSVPLLARRPPFASNHPLWPAYCALLKQLGVPLQTIAASLESLAVADVPLRFARRELDEGFDCLELETAEAIEISCAGTGTLGRAPQFPLEISAWHELKSLIDTLRELSTSQTPIGLGMVAGDVHTDIGNALAAGADFIILEFPHRATSQEPTADDLDTLLWSVVAARGAVEQTGRLHYPLYVDAGLARIDDLIKILALGASAVVIDTLVSHSLTAPVASPSVPHQGMLAGIGGLPKASTAPSIAPLAQKLEQFVEALRFRLRQQGLSHVRELTSQHLRATTHDAARLANVSLLKH